MSLRLQISACCKDALVHMERYSLTHKGDKCHKRWRQAGRNFFRVGWRKIAMLDEMNCVMEKQGLQIVIPMGTYWLEDAAQTR